MTEVHQNQPESSILPLHSRVDPFFSASTSLDQLGTPQALNNMSLFSAYISISPGPRKASLQEWETRYSPLSKSIIQRFAEMLENSCSH